MSKITRRYHLKVGVVTSVYTSGMVATSKGRRLCADMQFERDVPIGTWEYELTYNVAFPSRLAEINCPGCLAHPDWLFYELQGVL
jgi:hypothetical protein